MFRWFRKKELPESGLISLVLGEPPSTATAIARAAKLAAKQRRDLYESLAQQSTDVALAAAERVTVVDQHHMIAVGEEERPAIILMMHMGPFYIAMFKLISLLPKRGIMIIKAEAENEIEKRAYGHICEGLPSFELLRHADPQTPRRAIKGLKSGKFLITFVDLPPGFGPTLPGMLFGKPAQLSCGPVKIASLTGVNIVPFCTTLLGHDQTQLNVGAPIAVGRGEEAVQKATFQLWHQLESWIRRHPEQWQLWPILSSCWSVGDSHVVIGD